MRLTRVSFAGLLVAGCTANAYDVTVEIESETVRASADAIDVLVLAGGCPASLPSENDATLMGVQRTWTATPGGTSGPLDDLPPGLYGFFARARMTGIGCALAMGCEEEELTGGGGAIVRVAVRTNDACCVPSTVDREVEDYDCCVRARARVCGPAGRWEDFGAWSGCAPDLPDGTSAECAPGQVDTDRQSGCCGTRPERSRTCADDCSWSPWGPFDAGCGRCSPRQRCAGSVCVDQ